MIDFFIEIVLSAVIFSKMGSGKDSGKLLFKKIFSDGAFSIQDDGSSLTFSSSGISGASITKDQIAYGTGTGITSDKSFRVCTNANKESIFGFYSVRYNPSTAIASFVDPVTKNSFIVGGASNSITGSAKNSVIISGCANKNNSGALSNVIGGLRNDVSGVINNTIISGECNGMSGSNNLILSGTLNKLDGNQNFSGIISSSGSCLLDPINNTENEFNIIASTLRTCTINLGYGQGEQICGNFLSSTGLSKIILTPTFSVLSNTYMFNQEEKPFGLPQSTPSVKFNTILSTCKSVIDSCRELYGQTAYNNQISNYDTKSSGRMINIMGSCLSEGYSQCWYGRLSEKKYINIISSENSCSYEKYLNLISSENSCASKDSDNIIGGELHIIPYLGSGESSILGGCKHYSNELKSAIIGGFCNKSCANSLIMGGCCNLTKAGYNTILGGGCNYTCGVSNDNLLIGGKCNSSLISSAILGGYKNSAGFSRCSNYGTYNSGTQELISSGSFRGTNCNEDFTIMIGGCANKITLSCGSIIISGQKNCVVNSRDSLIVGGVDNQIQAHRIFGTVSENWFVLGQSYENVPALPAFNTNITNRNDPAPLQNRPKREVPPGENSDLRSYGILEYGLGYIKNSFIIGGCCNIFGSCIEKNYCSTYFNVGLTTSKSHYVYNSGIIGGFRNQIYNKSKILTESWNDGNNPNNCLVNSVIIGGSNIKLSKSNAFATGELIITGSNSSAPAANTISRVIICNPNNNPQTPACRGLSGVFSNPIGILVCEGFVIQVYQ